MLKTVKRASAVLGLIVLVLALTSADISAEQGQAETDPGLAGRGHALLRAIDMTLSDGMVQLKFNRNQEQTYVASLDLKETVSKMGNENIYRPALAILALWILAPVLIQIPRKPRKPRQQQRVMTTSKKPGFTETEMAGYHHVRGLSATQLVRVGRGLGSFSAIIWRTAARLGRGQVRIRRYRPRHAAAGHRHKTVILDLGRHNGFAA